MPMINGLAPLLGLQIGREEEPQDGFSLVPKVTGPRKLMMNILRQDPQMQELLKKLRMKGDGYASSVEPDNGFESQ